MNHSNVALIYCEHHHCTIHASKVGFINNVGYGIEKIEGRQFHPWQDLIGKQQWNDKGSKMMSIGFTNIFGYGVEEIEGRQFHPGQQGTAE